MAFHNIADAEKTADEIRQADERKDREPGNNVAAKAQEKLRDVALLLQRAQQAGARSVAKPVPPRELAEIKRAINGIDVDADPEDAGKQWDALRENMSKVHPVRTAEEQAVFESGLQKATALLAANRMLPLAKKKELQQLLRGAASEAERGSELGAGEKVGFESALKALQATLENDAALAKSDKAGVDSGARELTNVLGEALQALQRDADVGAKLPTQVKKLLHQTSEKAREFAKTSADDAGKAFSKARKKNRQQIAPIPNAVENGLVQLVAPAVWDSCATLGYFVGSIFPENWMVPFRD